MDFLEPSSIIEFLKIEPGHGLIQSLLLFMIWLNSRGLKKELVSLRDGLIETKIHYENRFGKIEERIHALETLKGAH